MAQKNRFMQVFKKIPVEWRSMCAERLFILQLTAKSHLSFSNNLKAMNGFHGASTLSLKLPHYFVTALALQSRLRYGGGGVYTDKHFLRQ